MLTDFHFLESKQSIGTFQVFLGCSVAYIAIHSFLLMYWNF